MKTVILTDRDMSLLKFLWRWKVVSTAALTEAFFGGLSPITAYVRLWHLRDGKYLQLVPDSLGKGFFWSLAPKGFSAIQNGLPELAEVGFRSENQEHDHLVTAIHLGEWLKRIPNNSEVFSEQELRRLHLEHYPSWVPKADDHRPDGYWLIPRNGKRITIALEVEINRKRDRFYRQLANFYDRHPEIQRVVWLVYSQAFGESVNHLIKAEVGSRSVIHNFILLKDLREEGWQSLIHFGAEEGKPLSFLLDPTLQTGSIPVWTRFLLNTRKCPHRSKTYLNSRPTIYRDRVASLPKIQRKETHG